MNDPANESQSNARGISRRTFIRGSAAAAALSALPVRRAPRIRRYRDVQIGAISYSYRELRGSAEEVLGYLLQAGLTTVELMGNVAEEYAGAPSAPAWPGRDANSSEIEAFRASLGEFQQEAGRWRASAPIEKFEELGRMYAAAGVSIDILKLGSPDWPDADIDYAYRAAQAVGARGISFEASDESAMRMGPFADRHALYNGMHNHTQVADPNWSFDRLLSYSPYNALNLDIGHYVAGTGESPIPVIRKYHDRITHLHLKDRRSAANGGANVPWGEGDTPIADVLRLIQQEGYPITAMIELEYPVPDGSNVLTEVAKCAGFCRGALN